jgi:15-cis-phytoene synthase
MNFVLSLEEEMNATKIHSAIFKKGSRTYFTSSLFFPRGIRQDVFTLYGFVRTADDFVDAQPQDGRGFADFRRRYETALAGTKAGDPIIDPFVELLGRRRFDPRWVASFLDSMQLDLSRSRYDTIEETLGYIHGSAEVIGLFMARILDLPEESLPSAAMLGRAMQYINFIRDIEEDSRMGRRYLSLGDTPLASLDPDYVRGHPQEFSRFIDRHISLYRGWQREAEKGFAFIPRRYRLPIKTASDMYAWTAWRIQNQPMVVFERKVKPRKSRIFLQAFANAIL